ncbi:PAS domain-containing protein [Pseudoalteromonas spongiae]|uniref:PAS domain-containing protein n=1 Tax=Pseudoalteromonas spongiae TaxID=298657 RepID=UPI00026CDA35|nr:PAS domain-containing protein [Pseudoalteromonas spongiae]ATD00460.1 hypothetical protein PSPO_b0432 [Pseudoalteromonas spongiae UST010723-006]
MTKLASASQQIHFAEDELIISKTDIRGNITYANRTFMRVSNFPESKLIGQPHNIIRHPDMPRGVYYGMWKTLKAKQEFFGFVKNLTADGDYYWVFANVTPDLVNGEIQGFFSVRRSPPDAAIKTISEVYQKMQQVEAQHGKRDGANGAWCWLNEYLQTHHNTSYEAFVLDLYAAE